MQFSDNLVTVYRVKVIKLRQNNSCCKKGQISKQIKRVKLILELQVKNKQKMDQPLIKVNHQQQISKSPVPAKTSIVQFYQNHQTYKTLTQKFHTISAYIFCSIQPLWMLLSYNILTLNNYNYFIQEFQSNFNSEYRLIYEQNRSTYAGVLEHVNSFANDYTIICCLVWIAHIGFELVLGYILYINRILFKEYSTGVKQMLPIFFTLLTTLVIRDCLLMSVSQVVQFDLEEIMALIRNNKNQFSNYGQNFNIFITTSLNLASNLHSKFSTLQIISTLQQVCDGVIICVLTVQIFRIYSSAAKCRKNQQELIKKKLYAVQPWLVGSNVRNTSAFGSNFSQECQYSKCFNHHELFASKPKISASQKDIVEFPIHNGAGYSLRSINLGEQNSFHSRFQKKQYPAHAFKVKTMKTSQPQIYLKKLKKSGSCNYLKDSREIIEDEPIQPTTAQQIHENQTPAIKLRKGVSANQDFEGIQPIRQRVESFDSRKFRDGKAFFKA